MESPRAAANRVLLEDIRRIHGESSGTYGSPRVHSVLRRRGRRIGRSRITRLIRQAGLRGLAALPRRTRTTDSRHVYPIAPNRLGRNFVANRPGQVWLADLTYIPTGEGWLYLAAVLDLHTREIVGWSMRETLHTEIALQALTMAIVRQRPAPGLIHHSDRGIQYAAEPYRRVLARSGFTPSMSRKGDCLDNAPMESFFHSLKTERVHHRIYGTRAEARRDLFQHIEGFYNSRPDTPASTDCSRLDGSSRRAPIISGSQRLTARFAISQRDPYSQYKIDYLAQRCGDWEIPFDAAAARNRSP
jgi:transposase InsO family protein